MRRRKGGTLARDRASDWLDPERAPRGDLRRWIVASALVHALAGALLLWSPDPRSSPSLPGVVTVDLVGMAGGEAAPAPPAAAPPAPPAGRAEPVPPKPEPEPVPEPEAAAPAPPRPEPPTRKTVLPKTPERPPEPKPKPRPEPEATPTPPPPRPEPKPKPAVAAAPAPKPPAPKPRPQEDYEDVLAQLRAERGEQRPTPIASAAGPRATGPAGAPGTPGPSGPPGAGGSGRPDAEVAAWLRAAQYHVEQAWVLPPGFQRGALLAEVVVRLDADGRVLGEPRIVRRSGDPWYDESVVRAIQKASPLPPPPEPGEWPFAFRPPGRG